MVSTMFLVSLLLVFLLAVVVPRGLAANDACTPQGAGDGDGDGNGATSAGDGSGDGDGDGSGDGDGDGSGPPVGLEAAGDGTAVGTEITYSGYMVDVRCQNLRNQGICAFDGEDIKASPEKHTTGCMLIPICKSYYLMKNNGTATDKTYTPVWALDSAGNAKAVEMLTAAIANRIKDEWTVTVKGTVGANNTLTVSSIARCCGANCDGCKGASPTCGGDTCPNRDSAVVSRAANVAPTLALVSAMVLGLGALV